ncbi:hypothetical protein Pyn_17837 [Prunus yedoensis var. nudiflora]|uniref:Uncharacterized protein n=1 Tax=Prunus yedoensis var. nudiflora TaxID=2094558 RepID=A0A314Z1B7_PRUYE|nr:hypothetical protein Pyn_17837 [Prunus yedoensis var. nudiflora]
MGGAAPSAAECHEERALAVTACMPVCLVSFQRHSVANAQGSAILNAYALSSPPRLQPPFTTSTAPSASLKGVVGGCLATSSVGASPLHDSWSQLCCLFRLQIN